MTFNVNEYLQTQAWLTDKYLVFPDASKVCKICSDKLYTMEFIDCDLFVDGKLPVCTKCLRSTLRGKDSRDVINESGLTVKCVKCEQQRLVGEMGMAWTKNKVDNRCKQCARDEFKKLSSK